MTITTEDTVVVSTVTLDVAIPLPFPVHSREEVQVYTHEGSLALLNVDYEVQLTPPAYSTASVIPKAGLVAKAESENVVILRILPLTQPTQVYSANQILGPALQQALDRAVMRDQQLEEKLSRSILRPITETDMTPWELPPAAERANKALGFDEDGKIIAVSDITNLAQLEEALDDIAAAVVAAAGSASSASTSAGTATTKANDATLAANAAADSATDAADILEDIQDFVAGLGSFTRRKLGPLTAGQTVINVPGGFSNAATMMVFFDSALLDLGGEYTAVTPTITLTEPAAGGEEITLIEFLAVSITDALIKTQNLADLTDKKTARLNMELTKVQHVADANAAIAAGTRVVYTSAAFTAARAFTLPAASAYNEGENIRVYDLVGAIAGANLMTLNRSGSDTINGATSVTISATRGGIELSSNGVDKWSFAVQTAPVATNGVLIGSSVLWNGPRLPAQYMWEDGAAVSRTTYSDLFAAITLVTIGTTTASNTSITGVVEDLRGLGLEGAPLEGAGISPGTKIASITATTIVMDTISPSSVAAGAIRILPHGVGNGTTTFNKPDGRGRASIGRDDMGGTPATRVTATGTGNPGLDGTRLGNAAGVDRHILLAAQMPLHSHNVNDPGHKHQINGGGGAVGSGTFGPAAQGSSGYTWDATNSFTGITIDNAGSDQAHPNLQPSLVRNTIVFAGV